MTSQAEIPAPADLDRLLVAMRPRLHRYCARMVGSVIDGEDVLQDAMVKAVEAFPAAGPLRHPEGWLFRIAHNVALDFLRRRSRQAAIFSQAELDMIADEIDAVTSRQIASASLRTFTRLPETQRACVILSDVLGCSLQEVCDVLDSSLPAVKASAASRTRKAARVRRRAAGCAAAETVRRRARPAQRLCRAFQCARFRRHPRHDRRRRRAGARQQDAHAGQGGG
jgi:RNA polymerase sigma factor (sigma-70 family)